MFEVLTDALKRARERSGAAASDEEYLTELLMLSAGKNPQAQTIYRPYWVAAKFLEQNRSAQNFKEADGVKFTGLATPIASLLQLQASMDAALGLTVPPGLEAITAECQTCTNQTASIPRFSTGTLPTQSRP